MIFHARDWRHRIEAVGIAGAFLVFRLLPVAWASTAGALLARALVRLPIAPLQRFDRIARRNIAAALPDLSPARRRNIRREMWGHIGRTLAEYPHLARIIAGPGLRVRGSEHIPKAKGGPGAIFVTAHFGNWELCPPIVERSGRGIITVYRQANNAIVDRIIHRLRRPLSTRLAPKGRPGARIILNGIRLGLHVGLVADQYTAEGIPVPFLARRSMTSTTAAFLSLKHQTPILLIHCLRRPGGRFDIIADPPLSPSQAPTRAAAIRDITTRINRRMEEWIRAHPEQWLWIHDRWKSRPGN